MDPIVSKIYDTERLNILDGSLALYHANWKPSNQWISYAGGTRHCHAGMVFWSHGHLLLLDMRQGVGGQTYRFSEEVKACPGAWDIYTIIDPNYCSDDAIRTMLEIIGKKYGWGSVGKALFMAAVRMTPILKSYYQKVVPDASEDTFPFCSMAVSRAVKGGGVDLCPKIADQFTEPGNLIQDKKKIVYQSTLIWEKKEAEK